MTCVYCGSPSTSNEHWFPRAFGVFSGYEMLKDAVCIACNSATSLAEQALVRYGQNAPIRARLGSKGRKRKKPELSAFQAGIKELPPVRLTVRHPLLGCPTFAEPLNGRLAPLFQAFFKNADGFRPVVIPPYLTSADLVLEFLRGAGNQDEVLVYVQYTNPPPSFADQLNEKLKALMGKKVEWVDRSEFRPEERTTRAEVEFTVSALQARAAAKIGFHYMLKFWGGRISGSDPSFSNLRSFILGKLPPGTDWQRFARMDSREKMGLLGGVPANYGHVLSLIRTDSLLQARIRLFLGPEWSPWTWVVNLGKPPGSIIYQEKIGHIFSYYPTPRNGCDGVFEPLVLGSAIQVPRSKLY